MAVPNGKPATDFSAMNREWVRAVAKEEAEKNYIAVESLSVTENNTYIAPAGKAYSPVIVNVPNPSTGKINITSTAEVDVTAYASAQVVDANLVAGNIKKDVSILGITGEYEGGGGSSPADTVFPVQANVNITNNGAESFEASAWSIVCTYDDVNQEYLFDYALQCGTGEHSFIFLGAGESCGFDLDTTLWSASVTGSAEVMHEDTDYWVSITGDCTITLTYIGT